MGANGLQPKPQDTALHISEDDDVQLAEARENLRLIQERKSQYVMEPDIPLDLIKQERRLVKRIEELEQHEHGERLERAFQHTASPAISTKVRRLESKLDDLRNLHQSSDCPFVLLGAVYLDIILYPVTTTILRPEEWINLDSIGCTLGGSALWVGKYLGHLGQRSYLFSAKGTGSDPFTKEFERLIDCERGTELQDELVPCSLQDSCIGITVHLIQPDFEFTTMFTCRGVLAKLGWRDVAGKLHERLEQGGVLYIGGYPKTNLDTDLREKLEALHRNTLICIDHGRLTPEQARSDAMKALRRVIRHGLVDVYFCTYPELLNFYEYEHQGSLDEKGVMRTLEELASHRTLPTITALRDDLLPGDTKAYIIVGRSVRPLRGEAGEHLADSAAGPAVGPVNAFNATMMYQLIHGSEYDKLEDFAIEAGNKALVRWEELRKGALESREKMRKGVLESRLKLR